MKQMLLRVPDEIHQRLAVRAAHTGQSVNALANQILGAAADVDLGDRRARLRARAAILGITRAVPAHQVSSSRRSRILASTHGMGAVLDRIMTEERERV